ncbi:hypothetical protein GCM10009131_23200 [Morganella psychrotolerans]
MILRPDFNVLISTFTASTRETIMENNKKIIRGGTFITMDESYGDIVNGVYGQGMQIYDF